MKATQTEAVCETQTVPLRRKRRSVGLCNALFVTDAAGGTAAQVREVSNALRRSVKTGAGWEYLPHDLPPPRTVSQQAQRWGVHGLHGC